MPYSKVNLNGKIHTAAAKTAAESKVRTMGNRKRQTDAELAALELRGDAVNAIVTAATTETAAPAATTETAAPAATTETAAPAATTETAAPAATTETAAQRLTRLRREAAETEEFLAREAAEKAAAARTTVDSTVNALTPTEQAALAAGILARLAADGSPSLVTDSLHAVAADMETAGIRGKLITPRRRGGGGNGAMETYKAKGLALYRVDRHGRESGAFFGGSVRIDAGEPRGSHPYLVTYDRAAQTITMRFVGGSHSGQSWSVRCGDAADHAADMKVLEGDGPHGEFGVGPRNPGASGTRILWSAANNICRSDSFAWRARLFNAAHPDQAVEIPDWMAEKLAKRTQAADNADNADNE